MHGYTLLQIIQLKLSLYTKFIKDPTLDLKSS